MTAHELARELLAGPDLQVVREDEQGLDSVVTLEKALVYKSTASEYFTERPRPGVTDVPVDVILISGR